MIYSLWKCLGSYDNPQDIDNDKIVEILLVDVKT
jgi:hypothetical protein